MADSDNIIIGPASVSIDGTDVGFTKEGVRVRMERTYVDVIADQVNGVVKKGRALERMYIATTLLEGTLANVQIAWDQPTSGVFGYSNVCVVHEHQIILSGKSPSCGTRTWTFYRCVSIAESEYSMSREEENAIPVEFECLKDEDNSDRFGIAVDS